MVEPDAIAHWLLSTFDGLVEKSAYGERQFFHNPGLVAPMGAYVSTLKLADGPNDRASKLDREGVFRLCFGLERAQYEARFGQRPSRPARGGIIDTGHDFAALDTITPHPVYGWIGWIQVLSPSSVTFETYKPLIKAARETAAAKFAKRKPTPRKTS